MQIGITVSVSCEITSSNKGNRITTSMSQWSQTSSPHHCPLHQGSCLSLSRLFHVSGQRINGLTWTGLGNQWNQVAYVGETAGNEIAIHLQGNMEEDGAKYRLQRKREKKDNTLRTSEKLQENRTNCVCLKETL